jgi:hypothetical protein
MIFPMEEIANQLAPKSPTLLNRRLFSDSRKQEKLFQRQKSAIEDILSEGGVSQVLKFASTVSNADPIGKVMADLDQPEFDAALLPALPVSLVNIIKPLPVAHEFSMPAIGCN